MSDDRTVPREVAEERSFGFWLFLMSDSILFSLLFATYAVMVMETDDGPTRAEIFNYWRTVANTALLLSSSVTMGLASIAISEARKVIALRWLALTMLLALVFLVLEGQEFSGLVAQGAGPDRSGFLSAYFSLVGTHGVHVTVGLIWMAVMCSHLVVAPIGSATQSLAERLTMFWHLVGIVWIGIYSMVYLPGLYE
jgi:cytochrome o ubiquinol oxidase subunit III